MKFGNEFQLQPIKVFLQESPDLWNAEEDK
jgi:hypothetical protein